MKPASLPAHPVGENHRFLGFEQPANSLLETFFRRLQRQRRGIAVERRKGHFAVELFFLHVAVVANIDRSHGLGRRQAIGANERIRHRFDAGRLVVPLDEVAHQIALHQSRVHPVDPGPAVRRIHRSGAAENDHRQAVRPGVVDRHRRMLQTDDVMHRRGHRFALGARIAVRQRDGDLFVVAKNNLRSMIAAVIDQRVVQTAKGRAGIDRDVFDLECLQEIDDHVRTPFGARLFYFLSFDHSFLLFVGNGLM